MFDFDAGKLVVIGVVALVVIGPKELPRVLRQAGQTVAKLRRMASEFQSQFMEAMREAEMADVKDEMSKIADSAKIDVAFDPVREVRNQIGGAIAGETTPMTISPTAETTNNSLDLAALESAVSPASGELAEGGLVAAGIAPAADVAPDPAVMSLAEKIDGDEPASGATLDEVRQALDGVRHARDDGSEHPVKEQHVEEQHVKEHLA